MASNPTEIIDPALHAKMRKADDVYTGGHFSEPSYMFEMAQPAWSVPFKGRAIVSATDASFMESAIKESVVDYDRLNFIEQRQCRNDFIEKYGFFAACYSFAGNIQDFSFPELEIIRDTFIRLLLELYSRVNPGEVPFYKVPVVLDRKLTTLNFRPLEWNVQLHLERDTIEVFR